MKLRPSRTFVVAVLLAVLVGINTLVFYYTDWLWFLSLDAQSVFWRMIRARLASGITFGILALIVVASNLWIAGRFTRFALRFDDSDEVPGGSVLKSRGGYLVVGAVVVFLMASIGAGQWALWLRFWNAESFGVADPIFGRDVGFYVFSLPFYQFVSKFLLGALIVSALAVGMIYVTAGGIRFQERLQFMPRPLAHFSALAGLFLLDLAWIYRLKVYGLLYSQGRVAFGAGYTDVNVQIWAYWLLVLVLIGAAAVFFMNLKYQRGRLPLMGIGLLVGGVFVVGAVPSTLVQKLVVEPSELAREKPYIQNNIHATRTAFGLDRIEEKPFEASEDLDWKDIQANPLTIRNARIWDERPLIQTYQQVQEIRPYYAFSGVDVDRYTVDGVYRQVMLSARELATDRLPPQARNFVNERLNYTHGYGIALSPVNHVTPEGLPDFMIKDIPPTSVPGLEVERPEIYYGERTYPYVVVKTSKPEFDYPKGDENQYTTYQGDGGVSMGGFFDRLMFTIRFKDVNLLLSNYITPESRIMFRRRVADERARTIAPFLSYDPDPYVVLSEGKIFWIIDAYTTTHMYPYSTRQGRARFNYIRNSVKVVVDAYNGSITYYQMDRKDPIIKAYSKIFPGLFKPFEAMPEDLKSHIRYPMALFRSQATVYQAYHMQDVQVFYNQEDLWEIPNEIYRDQAQPMEPYYVIVRLPEEEREEFLLMVPFTPSKKDNMIAWLAARSDGENYGDLLVYKLPKDKLIYGPMQLEARVDQQPEISSQLTLWGQRGSEVIRGNLLAIPIESSFLYIEPVYLQARQESEEPSFRDEGEGMPMRRRMPPGAGVRSTAIPELKQVIVAFGGQVLMRPTFEEGLRDLFGVEAISGVTGVSAEAETHRPGEALKQTAGDLAAQAEAQYNQVRRSMQEWDWKSAGEVMNALERTIMDLRGQLKEASQ